MEKNKSQIILLDKNGLETVAKVLSSGCWTINENGNLEIASSPAASNAPQLTIAQGNVRPITQVSGSGGSANVVNPVVTERAPTLQRDNSQVTTLTELGKKLVAAAKVGNTAQVRRLMAIGAPFASDGPIGMTPLHLAAQNGHLDTCDRLLCAGMNKDARNKVEKTPLHLAAMEGHTDIVSLLVKSGANINTCDMLNMTALHWACDRGHTSVVQLLLKNQAQTTVANKFSKSPLHLAVENGHQEIVDLLQDGLNFKANEDVVAVESISLDVTDDLHSIPVVCKTEEVCTEETLVEEVSESSECMESEEHLNIDNDLPNSILAEDSDDQNRSVLATLAELAEATSSRGTESAVDMSSVTALELIKAQAALMPLDDASTLVTSAVAQGQTLHLTEAGRQALKLINKEIPLLPTTSTLPQETVEEEDEGGAVKCKTSINTSNRQKPREKISFTTSSSSQLLADESSVTDLMPPLDSESIEIEEEKQPVTQVITLSPEQYAALTGGTNGPIILQVLQSGEQLNDLDTGQGPPTAKRQKVMQLVTQASQGTTGLTQPIAKVSGQVLSVNLPSTSQQ